MTAVPPALSGGTRTHCFHGSHEFTRPLLGKTDMRVLLSLAHPYFDGRRGLGATWRRGAAATSLNVPIAGLRYRSSACSHLEPTRWQVDCDARLIRLNPPSRRQTNKRRPALPICDLLLPYLGARVAYPVMRAADLYLTEAGRSRASTPRSSARDEVGLSRDVIP